MPPLRVGDTIATEACWNIPKSAPCSAASSGHGKNLGWWKRLWVSVSLNLTENSLRPLAPLSAFGAVRKQPGKTGLIWCFCHEICYPQPFQTKGILRWVKHNSHAEVLSIKEITLYFMVFSVSEISQLGWYPKPKFPTGLLMNWLKLEESLDSISL